jgi:hypothetical protein
MPFDTDAVLPCIFTLGGIDEDEISLADTDMHEAFDIESAFGEFERDGRLP